MSEFFDTHCHLDASAFDGDREATWARAEAAGVVGALIPAVEPSLWARTLSEATGPRVAALGIHPQALPALTARALDEALANLTALVRAAGSRVVAIGECGFEGHGEKALQRKVFLAHAEAARDLDLPLVLHVRGAHGDALTAMRAAPRRASPGVIHGFSSSPEVARAYLAMGWYLAVGGAVTRPTARRPVEALRVIPAARLLLETDAPDQVPTGVPTGVHRCEPAHLAIVAQHVAKLRGDDLDALAATTTANARALFRLLPTP